MMESSKELLAADRLSRLAGKGSRTLDAAKRTSEALAWLDKNLEAEVAATRAKSGHATSAPTQDSVASNTKNEIEVRPSKSKAEMLREKIERRGLLQPEPSTRAKRTDSSQTFLSQDAQARLKRLKEGHDVGEGEDISTDKKEMDLWADSKHRQHASLVHVRPFPDLSATSKAARLSAAPHIAGIYDQIFVENIQDTSGVPDCEPVDDRFQECTLVLDEHWDTVDGGNNSVGGEKLGRRSTYELRLTQNIADCLDVPLHRIQVTEMHPGPSWYRVNELVVQLTLLPDIGGRPPTCKKLCEELQRQAKTNNSRLRQRLPALRAEVPEEDSKLPFHAPDSKPPFSFSLLRGGIVEDRMSKNEQKGIISVDNALLARDHMNTAPHHVQYMTQKVFFPVLRCSTKCLLSSAS